MDQVVLLSFGLYLLQEGRQVAGPPLVRFGQVDVLQVEHQVLAVLGPEDPAGVGAEQHAGLAQLLQDVAGGRLGAAVDHRHLGGAQPREGVAEEHSGRKQAGFSQMVSPEVFFFLFSNGWINSPALKASHLFLGQYEDHYGRSKGEKVCNVCVFKEATRAPENNVCQITPKGNGRHFKRAQHRRGKYN